MAAVGRLFILNSIKRIQNRTLRSAIRLASNKPPDSSVDELDKPIQYSTSKAATWKAEYSFRGTEDDDVTPWYQPIVVCMSVGIFLLYFAVLREENDVDEGLSMSLYDRIEGLEELQLKTAINYYKENEKSYDTGPMERRLAELEVLKKKIANA